MELLDESYRISGLYSTPVRDVIITQKQRQALFVGVGIGLLLGAILLRRRGKKQEQK